MYLVRLNSRVFGLVALVGRAFGINVRIERDPFSVRRPNRVRGAGRDFRHFFAVGSVGLHGPDLPGRGEGDPFTVRRPARCTAGTVSRCDLFEIGTVDSYAVYLINYAIGISVHNADRECDRPTVRREL